VGKSGKKWKNQEEMCKKGKKQESRLCDHCRFDRVYDLVTEKTGFLK
jgi:hypothetical protein